MTGPTGRAMAQMIAVFAELEREMIKARIADSRRKAQEDGRFHGGRFPYGLTVADHPSGKGRVLVRDGHAASLIREAAGWLIDGVNLTECARRINERGEPTSRQRGAVLKGTEKAQAALWRPKALKEILTHPTTRGYRVGASGEVEIGDDGSPLIAWDPVISETEWDAVQEALAALSIRRHVKEPAASHWLSGRLLCDICGSRLKQHVAARANSFTCSGPAMRTHTPGVYVNRDKIVGWVKTEFPRIMGMFPEVRRTWVPGSDASRDLADVKRAIRRMRDDREAGVYDDDEDDYRARMSRLTARRSKLQEIPEVTPHWDESPTGRKLRDVWESLDDAGKGELLITHGLHVIISPAASRTAPVGDRARFEVADLERDALEDVLLQESE